MSLQTEEATKLQAAIRENYNKLKAAEKTYNNEKSTILAAYDKLLDEYQLKNPNIPVYESWKRGTRSGCSNESYIKLITLDITLAQHYAQKRCSKATHWTKERKLRNMDLEDLRKLYPLKEN